MSAFSSFKSRAGFRRSKGFALVITLIMVALAAIIVIALLNGVSSDRVTANSYSKRARAEMAAQSGLAAALNALSGSTGPSDFRFITAVGDDPDSTHAKPVLIPLTTPDATTATISLNNSAKRFLYSDSTTSATLTLSTSTNAKVTRQAGYVSIADTRNQETERYAFYIDEAGSRQNLAIQGPVQSPTPRARAYARDPNELPIVTATAKASPFNSAQLSALNNQRALLFTPMTVNPVLADAGASAANPSVDGYAYTAASAMTNLTPEGKPRVDLTKLKAYVDGLSVDQTSSNPRAKLVDRLLCLATPQQSSEWGGGDLSVLLKLGRYTQAQSRQIVANLLDYIDSDLIPTTDNIDNPTYFGVEGKANAEGTVVGHPYINFVGTGLVFNRSTNPSGALNSTRVIVFLGVVNPWSAPTKPWETFYIQPEIQVQIHGTASAPPGTLGTDAGAYFHSDFTTSDSNNLLTDYPASTIPPNTGYLFPHTVGTGTPGLYANFDDLLGAGQQQPPSMTFTSVTFAIKKLRLKYTSTDGRSGYVQVLDGLKAITQPMSQATISMGTTSGGLDYRIGQTGNTTKGDFHLNGDPRLNFVSQPSPTPGAIWILAKSSPIPTASPSASWPPVTGSPSPAPPPQPSPIAIVSVFAVIDSNNSDFPSPTPSPSDTNYSWYTKTNITSDFYVKSPPTGNTVLTPTPSPIPALFDSVGELGFIHTGIPWETLRFYVTGSETHSKQRDKELLAYVQSGTFNSADYGTVPLHAPTHAPTPTPINLISGPINVNTNKRPTLQSLFLGASSKLDSDAAARANGTAADPDAASIADDLGANAATAPFTLPGDFLARSAIRAITNTQTSDFDREILARRTANVLAMQSTRFTVYCLGEARDKLGASVQTTSTVNLRAEVELQSDSTGKPVPKVLSAAYYLTN
jgi:Tfp pilus assembly protein PilX